MAEEDYNESLKEIDPLLGRINKAMNECVEQGVEPEALLLGPEEFRRMEAYVMGTSWRNDWVKANYGSGGPATRIPMIFQGLRVERSEVPGVRVGWVSGRQ